SRLGQFCIRAEHDNAASEPGLSFSGGNAMNGLTMVLLEGGLIFGGALAFYFWQMRDLKREKEKRAKSRTEES
ncbi:MAG TPA: hypothetical protein DCL95_06655, partial [Rhodospirillaceae bacterium]|nr:hypothetical protein [Rhodospirillaceae bacterium]